MADRKLIKFANARLSFPCLFQTESYGGEDTGKYTATFILDKTHDAAAIKEIQAQIAAITKDAFKGKILGPDRICLKEGDSGDRPEYENKMVIKGSTKKRPMVLGRDKRPITEEDNIIYAGCYVNGIISLWSQDNQFGKRINCTLEGIMFSGHGEPFGSAGVSVEEFDMFESEEMPF